MKFCLITRMYWILIYFQVVFFWHSKYLIKFKKWQETVNFTNASNLCNSWIPYKTNQQKKGWTKNQQHLRTHIIEPYPILWPTRLADVPGVVEGVGGGGCVERVNPRHIGQVGGLWGEGPATAVPARPARPRGLGQTRTATVLASWRGIGWFKHNEKQWLTTWIEIITFCKSSNAMKVFWI